MYSPLTSIFALIALMLPGPGFATLLKKQTTLVPVMGGASFPDPAVIRVDNGWHLFSTRQFLNGTQINVQRAFTSDYKTFNFRRGVDALPKLPAWVDRDPRVWAPDVVRRNDGSYIMYYTAAIKRQPNLHCLSFATAKDITQPFVDNSSEPWICPTEAGGAIDIAGYVDENRSWRRWVVYKIDGNALGHGGDCGNTVPPILPTPIMLQEIDQQDGHTLIGKPVEILTNIASDGPYVEAPTLTYMSGKYVLFFSSQCYQTPKYDVQYAVADKITGPYTRKGRIFATGTYGMTAPGGLDIAINGEKAVWHA